MNLPPPKLSFDTAVFDLDGVITQTARVHAVAWKKLFDAYLKKRSDHTGEPFREFDIEEDYLRKVDGKPRYKGVQSFLESRGIALPFGDPDDSPDRETACGLGNQKQEFFLRALEEQGVAVYEPAVGLLHDLRNAGIRLGIASSSKNCLGVLQRAGLDHLFEARVDGVVSAELGLSGKPEPDIFVRTVELLGSSPERAVVLEDAVSGVQAGRAGAFGLVLGVDRGGNRTALWQGGADLVVPNLGQLSVERIEDWFRVRHHARPSAIFCWKEIEQAMGAKRVALFVSCDATLQGQDAGWQRMRQALTGLADQCTVCVVSAKATQELRDLLRLESVTYAGRGGSQIAAPAGSGRGEHADAGREPADPDRGSVVKRVLEAAGIQGPDARVLYLGDLTADEAAFSALGHDGAGILVAELPRPTAARYSLQRADDVHDLLDRLTGFSRGAA